MIIINILPETYLKELKDKLIIHIIMVNTGTVTG